MSCQLISSDGLHEPVELGDGVALVIGRSPATQITDSKVSRQHCKLLNNRHMRELSIVVRIYKSEQLTHPLI